MDSRSTFFVLGNCFGNERVDVAALRAQIEALQQQVDGQVPAQVSLLPKKSLAPEVERTPGPGDGRYAKSAADCQQEWKEAKIWQLSEGRHSHS